MKAKPTKVSIRDIARELGLSKTTVGYALQNRPEVNAATRERVLAVAARLGYAPDARVTSYLTTVRNAQSKDLLPIAWLNTTPFEASWSKYKYLSPYLEGAAQRAQELGYRLDEIWTRQPEMTMKRIARILHQRGIEGAIITYPARHFHLGWDHLAGVALGSGLLAPRLHRFTQDIAYNFALALKMVGRLRYRRIGVCLDEAVDRRHTLHAIRSTVFYLNATKPKSERVEPLFFTWRTRQHEDEVKEQVSQWISQRKPEVIICHAGYMLARVQQLGLRVPEDIGLVHLATDDDVSDWAGINSRKREIGASATEAVVSLMQRRQFGIPKTPLNCLVRGFWHPGRTLRVQER
jgi:LacI family transcriptional regulator